MVYQKSLHQMMPTSRFAIFVSVALFAIPSGKNKGPKELVVVVNG
jgi:hypothetical protein